MKRSHYLIFAAALISLTACSSGHSTRMTQAVSANVTGKTDSRYTGPKRRVGVIDFENKTAYGGRLGTAATDILITELTKTGKFIVVERDKMDKLMEEQRLGMSGAIDPNTAAKMGKILGLNAIVTGSVSQFGVATTGSDYLLVQTKKQVADATVDIRVVDAETGQVLYADSGEGKSTSSNGQVLGLGTRGGYNETIEGEALRAAISQLVENITSQINKKQWSCRVADVQNGQVYLDAGQESGLQLGQKLTAYHLGREIKSPTTGLVIGFIQDRVGEIEVTDFFGENGAVAKIDSGSSPSPGDLAKLPN